MKNAKSKPFFFFCLHLKGQLWSTKWEFKYHYMYEVDRIKRKPINWHIFFDIHKYLHSTFYRHVLLLVNWFYIALKCIINIEFSRYRKKTPNRQGEPDTCFCNESYSIAEYNDISKIWVIHHKAVYFDIFFIY